MLALLKMALPLVAFQITYAVLAGEAPPLWMMLAAGFCHGWTLGRQRVRDHRRLGARRP